MRPRQDLKVAEASTRPASLEAWVTKADIASYYRFTTRWVESQVALGMPSRLISGRRRFRLSDVDKWLERRSAAHAL
jgi:hypothetical protein